MTEAEVIAMVKALGTAKDILKGNPSSPLAQLLQDLMQDVTNQLIEKMHQYKLEASGNLMQSIRPTESATLDGDVLTVAITAPFYWKFVNYGVNGTEEKRGYPEWGTAPKENTYYNNISSWVRNKGLTLADFGDAFPDYTSLTYGLMNSIKKKGIEKRPFFTDVVNEKLYDALAEPISTLIGRAITINIVEPWQ